MKKLRGMWFFIIFLWVSQRLLATIVGSFTNVWHFPYICVCSSKSSWRWGLEHAILVAPYYLVTPLFLYYWNKGGFWDKLGEKKDTKWRAIILAKRSTEDCQCKELYYDCFMLVMRRIFYTRNKVFSAMRIL